MIDSDRSTDRARPAKRAAAHYGADSRSSADRTIHDLRNSLAAVILNLEIAANPEYASGIALEAAVDALAEAKNLREALAGIRGAIEARP